MRIFQISFSAWIMINSLQGEGIPVNEARTRCEAPHYLVQANEEQKEELAVCGTFTLTSEQWRAVRVKYPAIPKRIPKILPSTYNDCSCGLNDVHWGIWFADGSVAIMSELDHVPFEQLSEEGKRDVPLDLQYCMDGRGQFYASNRLVPYKEVKTLVGSKPNPVGDSTSFQLTIEIPPGMSRRDAALAERIDELERLSKSVGRNFYVFWSE